MAKNDGGPAFPVLSDREYERGDGNSVHALDSDSGGMSLRDYFAAKAMVVLMNLFFAKESLHQISRWSYEAADSMLAERSK